MNAVLKSKVNVFSAQNLIFFPSGLFNDWHRLVHTAQLNHCLSLTEFWLYFRWTLQKSQISLQRRREAPSSFTLKKKISAQTFLSGHKGTKRGWESHSSESVSLQCPLLDTTCSGGLWADLLKLVRLWSQTIYDPKRPKRVIQLKNMDTNINVQDLKCEGDTETMTWNIFPLKFH